MYVVCSGKGLRLPGVFLEKDGMCIAQRMGFQAAKPAAPNEA